MRPKIAIQKPLFSLGAIVSTPAVLAAFQKTGQDPRTFIRRHITGDWGDVPEADKKENDVSIDINLRILSAYTLTDGTKFWIITEGNRSATTFLLPDEY